MGIEPTAGVCPATGFEVQERHQAANYSRKFKQALLIGFTVSNYIFTSRHLQVLKLGSCG